MHVVVTRPEPDARDMKSRLEGLGCRVTLAPLLSIAPQPIEAGAIADARALIATSRNAISALAASPDLATALRMPVFAVGVATAARARQAGFETVITGPGNAAELVRVITAHPSAASGPVLHLAGDHLAADLPGMLAGAGVVCRSIVVYHSLAATDLPVALLRELASDAVDAVILMSPRTAQIWRELAAHADLQSVAPRPAYVCLSEAVAQALRSSGRPSAYRGRSGPDERRNLCRNSTAGVSLGAGVKPVNPTTDLRCVIVPSQGRVSTVCDEVERNGASRNILANFARVQEAFPPWRIKTKNHRATYRNPIRRLPSAHTRRST